MERTKFYIVPVKDSEGILNQASSLNKGVLGLVKKGCSKTTIPETLNVKKPAVKAGFL